MRRHFIALLDFPNLGDSIIWSRKELMPRRRKLTEVYSLGVASKTSNKFGKILGIPLGIRLSKSFDVQFPQKYISSIGAGSYQTVLTDMDWVDLLVARPDSVVIRLQDDAEPLLFRKLWLRLLPAASPCGRGSLLVRLCRLLEIFDIGYLVIDSYGAILRTRNEDLNLLDHKLNAVLAFVWVGFSDKREELNVVDIWTMVVKFIEFLTILPVPYDDFAVFASGRQIPITLTDIKVCDNILMTVERGLQI